MTALRCRHRPVAQALSLQDDRSMGFDALLLAPIHEPSASRSFSRRSYAVCTKYAYCILAPTADMTHCRTGRILSGDARPCPATRGFLIRSKASLPNPICWGSSRICLIPRLRMSLVHLCQIALARQLKGFCVAWGAWLCLAPWIPPRLGIRPRAAL